MVNKLFLPERMPLFKLAFEPLLKPNWFRAAWRFYVLPLMFGGKFIWPPPFGKLFIKNGVGEPPRRFAAMFMA